MTVTPDTVAVLACALCAPVLASPEWVNAGEPFTPVHVCPVCARMVGAGEPCTALVRPALLPPAPAGRESAWVTMDDLGMVLPCSLNPAYQWNGWEAPAFDPVVLDAFAPVLVGYMTPPPGIVADGVEWPIVTASPLSIRSHYPGDDVEWLEHVTPWQTSDGRAVVRVGEGWCWYRG